MADFVAGIFVWLDTKKKAEKEEHGLKMHAQGKSESGIAIFSA